MASNRDMNHRLIKLEQQIELLIRATNDLYRQKEQELYSDPKKTGSAKIYHNIKEEIQEYKNGKNEQEAVEVLI